MNTKLLWEISRIIRVKRTFTKKFPFTRIMTDEEVFDCFEMQDFLEDKPELRRLILE